MIGVEVRTPDETCVGSLVLVDADGVEDILVFTEEDELREIRDQINDVLGEVSARGKAATKVIDTARAYIASLANSNTLRYTAPRYIDLKAAVAAYDQACN